MNTYTIEAQLNVIIDLLERLPERLGEEMEGRIQRQNMKLLEEIEKLEDEIYESDD